MEKEAYLFTFCPPGPEDLLKVTWQMLRGIVSGPSLASHFLAVTSSSSSAPSPARLVAKHRGRLKKPGRFSSPMRLAPCALLNISLVLVVHVQKSRACNIHLRTLCIWLGIAGPGGNGQGRAKREPATT